MNEIYYIATKLDKKWAKTFKQLGNQVKALIKTKYIDTVLPNIQNYYITAKADGLRCFLIITDRYVKYVTSEDVVYLQIPNTFTATYIFDCEYVNNKVYIFDVIVYNNDTVAKKTFRERYALLQQFQNILVEKILTHVIEVKHFIPLTIANYQNSICNLYKLQNNKSTYKTDGLIFVEANAEYNRTINLKWKPANFLTIDFLAIRISNNKYVLCVGIKSSLLQSFNMHVAPEFTALLSTLQLNINDNYVPVPFYNSLVPNIYYYTHTDNTDLHGCVIELSLNKDMTWLFHRIRTDRNVELSSGTYYGNNYGVAEQTLSTIINPLSIKDLITPYQMLVKDIYFGKQDNAYKTIKHFNNYIKNLLIMRYTNCNYVIDLASGRGGDLNKYVNAHIKNVLMLELDTNAIEEVINRKYTILDTPAKQLNFVILQINLNNNYKKNITNITNTFNNVYVNADNILGQQSSVIFCHFAAHYLVETATSAQNFASFVSHYLLQSGTFIATLFDAPKVFALLKTHGGKWQVDNKYMIQYVGKQPAMFSGFSHKIKVLLPLSSIPYEECLVDLLAVDKVFAKKQIYRSEEKNFADIIVQNTQLHNAYREFSENDKIFIGLYKYVIYTKR